MPRLVTVGHERASRWSRIHTERLVLEPVSHGHDNDLLAAALASRAELLPWMPWAVDLSMEHQSAYTDDRAIPGWAAGSPAFAITEHGEAIGVIGLDRRSASKYEIHYWLRTDRTGRGYVTEAARGLLSWARDALGARRIVLNAGMENRRSLAVAERSASLVMGSSRAAWRAGAWRCFPPTRTISTCRDGHPLRLRSPSRLARRSARAKTSSPPGMSTAPMASSRTMVPSSAPMPAWSSSAERMPVSV